MSTPISPSTTELPQVSHTEFLAAFQRLSRSGFRSSEFAAVLIALALLALAAWGGRLSPEWAAALGSALPVAYGYFRNQIKNAQGDRLLMLADIVAGNPRAALAKPAELVTEIEHRTIGTDESATVTVASTPSTASVAPLLALWLLVTGCAPLSAYNQRNGISVSGGITYDGASANVTRRPDGKTMIGVQVDAAELQRDLGK